MRQLYLLRHAKAVTFQPGATDHQRPLTEVGRRQSAELGDFLRGSDLPPIDQVLCSTSTRTRQTLEGLGLDCPATFSDAIYNATTDDLLAELAASSGDTVLVVGHSPSIPSLALDLADESSDPDTLATIGSRFPPSSIGFLQVSQPWPELSSARLTGLRLGVASG